MRYRACVSLIFSLALSLQAASVSLTGLVVDKLGMPVADADVSIEGTSIAASTNGVGEFSLNGTVAAMDRLPTTGKAVETRLINGTLSFTVERDNTPVTVDIVDCAGRSIGSRIRLGFGAGSHSIDISRMSGRLVAGKLYYAVIQKSGSTSALKYLWLGPSLKRASPTGDSRGGFMAKRFAYPDSLRIAKPGYITRYLALTALTGARSADTLVPDTLARTLFIPSDTAASDVLFYTAEAGGGRILVHASVNDDDTVSYYATFEDEHGAAQGAVVYSRNFIPVQWVAPGYTVTVYRRNRTVAFNPAAAFHAMSSDTARKEDTISLNINPENLAALAGDMHTGLSVSPLGMSAMVTKFNITTFDDLVTRARAAGPDRELLINAALSISTARAALALKTAAGLPKRSIVGADAAFKIIVKLGARAAANAALDALKDDLDPAPTGIGILLCQGAAKYGVCHYRFFFCKPTATGAVDPSAVRACMSFCTTSMGCFSNICMPMDLSEATGGFGGGF